MSTDERDRVHAEAADTAYLLTTVHEAGHWVAGRAVGVPAIFRVSYRGAFLVFETDSTPLVTHPRRKRYGPLLAGTAIDATTLAAVLALRRTATRYGADVVLAPYPRLEHGIALTAWGRIDLLDRYDETRIARFVEALRGRYVDGQVRPAHCPAD